MTTTLFINRSNSRCGACNKNADPYENAHDNVTMNGEGCGAKYVGVASDYFGIAKRVQEMRPDLPWVGMSDTPPWDQP